MRYRLFIHNVLQDASQIALEYFGKISAIREGNIKQVLHKADIEVGAFILDQIKKEFPRHTIIDKKSGVVGQKAEFTWVIDPINGTSNFVNGVPQFGIMIGVLYKNVPLAGGICLPYYSKILSAEKNEGAFCNGDLIHVTKESELSQTLTGFHIGGQQLNFESMRAEVSEIGELLLCMTNLRISSLSYDISLVAQGNYGGYVSKTGTILDTVAPNIIIEEAGGIYTDFYGENIRYLDVLGNISRNYTCCTASPSLHKQLQSVIHAK